jgi:hypothetical protein
MADSAKDREKVSGQVFGKLRSAITYLAIREVTSYFDDADVNVMDVAMMGIVVYVVSGAFVHMLKPDPSVPGNSTLMLSFFDVEYRVLLSVNRLSIMLSGQALAIWVLPVEFDADTAMSVSQASWVVMWIVAMLSVLSLLPTSFTQTDQGSSFQSVLLYTFTDGIEAQFYKLNLDPFVLFCLALAVLYALQRIHSEYLEALKTAEKAAAYGDCQNFTPNAFRSMSHEALCMVLANVCIVGVLPSESGTLVYANVLLLGQLAGGVILVGYLAEKIEVAASVQTLILWRASREAWDWIYAFTEDDFVILFSLILLYFFISRLQKQLAYTVILVLSKHIVTIALREVQHLPQLPSMVASYVLLIGVDILTFHL